MGKVCQFIFGKLTINYATISEKLRQDHIISSNLIIILSKNSPKLFKFIQIFEKLFTVVVFFYYSISSSKTRFF